MTLVLSHMLNIWSGLFRLNIGKFKLGSSLPLAFVFSPMQFLLKSLFSIYSKLHTYGFFSYLLILNLGDFSSVSLC